MKKTILALAMLAMMAASAKATPFNVFPYTGELSRGGIEALMPTLDEQFYAPPCLDYLIGLIQNGTPLNEIPILFAEDCPEVDLCDVVVWLGEELECDLCGGPGSHGGGEVPEPGTMLLVGLGLLGVGSYLRKR